jgi:hypothetical protein
LPRGRTVRLTVVGTVVVPRGVPVTWKVREPITVSVEETLMVRLLVTPVGVGVTLVGLKETHETPEANNEEIQDRVTGWPMPAFKVAVMATVVVLPCWTATGPLLDRE